MQRIDLHLEDGGLEGCRGVCFDDLRRGGWRQRLHEQHERLRRLVRREIDAPTRWEDAAAPSRRMLLAEQERSSRLVAGTVGRIFHYIEGDEERLAFRHLDAYTYEQLVARDGGQ